MLYLFQKNSIYYYKRKIPTTRKNIVFSLETDSFEKAKFMLNSLNPILEKIFLFVKDGVMEVMDELDYINDVIDEYKKKALIEYGELEKLRHEAYTYKTKKGKIRVGSHPKAIDKALNYLLENLHAQEQVRDRIAEDILNSSNIIPSVFKELPVSMHGEFKDRL